MRFTKNYSEKYILQTLCDMISNQIHEKLILSFIERNEIEMVYHSNAIMFFKQLLFLSMKMFKKKLIY